ncbi:DUF4129 domain-containing protein [Lysobacter auxotrophicus]|uniref:DUF4129 domain-containing protein n=1 Tax=Lysobacter auxotrophicus TaxID=2992573 RepID=A0ABM8D919_9GAMM|nr:DUF4129 domain-containing protein [Lysobacter auxotrophicus]BDU15048.1 DUF4129 domain-containing protein [Lysobacter auxotrophicus]
MKIESLTVALRPRTAWEAVELGTALVRRHAAAIWKPWLLLTLPLFVLFNALAWTIDALWLAGLLMWWLKPAFDRIPLFVLSRAVFGDVPTLRQTLAAQRNWGLSWLPGYLLWRRLSPLRSLNLPVDLLEGARGADARERRRALGAPVHGVAALATIVCLHFELAVYVGLASLAIVFVPDDYLQETLNRAWIALKEAPAWLSLLSNALAWIAASVIEPFYVGAGFGLYLNRRTEVEAWDIELALRRMRERLLRSATPLLLALAIGMAFAPAVVRAQDAGDPQDTESVAGEEDADAYDDAEAPRVTLQQVFGRVVDETGLRDGVDAQMTPQPAPPAIPVSPGGTANGGQDGTAGGGRSLAGDGSLRRAVRKAYADPTVSPKRKVVSWKKRDAKKPDPKKIEPPPLGKLGEVLATVGEFGLWIVVIALAGLLLVTAPRWLAWFRGGLAREAREDDEVRRDRADEPLPPLPEDIPSVIRRLWREGRQREALAMLYRASVETMLARTQVVLVPGATESDVLRASRKLPRGEDRDAFARAVRTWQYAAYAHSFPAGEEFESLLADLASRFGWLPGARIDGSVPA